ncbi:DUF3592 domain-containing protein [Cellulomonas bogoriensis]|nr:DUF3592 domain-containing protein [Cellulomonas bogoriensis]
MRFVAAILPLVLFAVPGAVLVVVGLRLQRQTTSVPRVPVQAVVVEYSNWSSPKRVVFDYPAPDGTWIRARRMTGIAQMQTRGLLVRPGDGITVYVDPKRPHDVNLGPVGSASGFAGVAMIVFGAGLVLAGLSNTVTFARFILG